MAGYAEIAAHYREVIQRGDLRPGDALPSYTEAAKTHQVNRTTVIRAYDVLKSEGLASGKPGKAIVVLGPATVLTGPDRLDRLAQTGRNYGHGEDSINHSVSVGPCTDPDACTALSIRPGEEVILRIRTFRQDGRPSAIGLSVIHPRAAADVPELQEEGPLPFHWHTAYSDRTGREVTRGQRTAQARQASPRELEALEIDAPEHVSVAVLVSHVTFHDEEGPLERWEDVYAPGTQMPIKE